MLRRLKIHLLLTLLVCSCLCAPGFAADTGSGPAGAAGKSPQPAKTRVQLRPTANRMGYEDTAVNDLLKRFLAFAPGAPGHLMDIGCARGFAIQQVLLLEDRDAFLRPHQRKIFAVDMSREHLDHIAATTPADLVVPVQMHFPVRSAADEGRCFAPGSLGAVYAGLVLHYLDGPELRQGLDLLFAALASGGRVYASVNSPFDSAVMAREFLRRKNTLKEEYPGWLASYDKAMLPERVRNQIPDSIHVFDIETLSGYMRDAGFNVVDCYYFKRGKSMMMQKILGIVAEKPAPPR